MLCVCGKAELPIKEESVRRAKDCQWPSLTKRFNRVYYRGLASMGVAAGDTHKALQLLGGHRRCLKLSPSQVRGAWGIEKGVFERGGGFRQVVMDGMEVDVVLMNDLEGSGLSNRAFHADEWNEVEAEALEFCSGMVDQIDIETEFRWIRANLGEWPDFGKAPSRGAIKDWLVINKPGNEALVRDFVNLAWSKRLAADRKGSTSVFREDRQSGSPESEAHDDELERRLG